jgi:isoaspartyl peptidase/L-asparaginase-like protein (Ntn-hydrolase superfamily)
VADREQETAEPLVKSVRALIQQRLLPGQGGMIGVSKDGCAICEFNTIGMWRGWTNHWGVLEIGGACAAYARSNARVYDIIARS